jgi:2-keto-3-deoxy-6-phosphogluconate aldolase
MEAGNEIYRIHGDCVDTLEEAVVAYKQLVEAGYVGIEITVKTETYSCVTETIDVKTLMED